MPNLETIIQEIIQFRNDRDWEQFHNSKDLALAISIEASELNELFLWKKAEDVNIGKLKEELADIFTFGLLLAHKHGLNVVDIVQEKLKANALKYPVDKAKGTAKKYNEFDK
jgi:NTP pyrophosphatase (non-canonical NTP hydrolase)